LGRSTDNCLSQVSSHRLPLSPVRRCGSGHVYTESDRSKPPVTKTKPTACIQLSLPITADPLSPPLSPVSSALSRSKSHPVHRRHLTSIDVSMFDPYPKEVEHDD
jgi:hypothetical protein